MIHNVLFDTARHAGHADMVREAIDGSVGTGPVFPNTVSGEDEEYWRMYLARITGELDRESWMAYNHSRPDYDPSAWENFIRRAHASLEPDTQS
jgi:hypothetical protein